jgi:hypothetical protein
MAVSPKTLKFDSEATPHKAQRDLEKAESGKKQAYNRPGVKPYSDGATIKFGRKAN